VITVFEQIHSEEPEYRDREGLLQSAHEALEQEQADRTERAPPQLPALAGSWLALAVRGLVMAIFGLVLLFFYDTGDFRLYGALMIIADGVCATIDATTRAGRRRPLLIQGRISGLVGLFILFVWLVRDISILSSISASAQTFLDGLFDELAIAPRLVGTWAIFIGIIRIIAAIQLRWDTKNLLLMGTSGVLLVIFGILLLPKQPSGQPYPWSLFGFLVLASGITLMIFAFRVGWPRFRRVIRVK